MSGQSTATSHPAPVATRYEFVPAEMLVGDPMDTAHLHDPRAIAVEWRGGDRWAVKRGSSVWDGEAGDWEYEPIPSSRNAEFFRRCRFTRDEALSIGSFLVERAALSGSSAGVDQ